MSPHQWPYSCTIVGRLHSNVCDLSIGDKFSRGYINSPSVRLSPLAPGSELDAGISLMISAPADMPALPQEQVWVSSKQGGYYRQDPQPMNIEINHMEMDPASPPPPPPEQTAAAAEPAPPPLEDGAIPRHGYTSADDRAVFLICDLQSFKVLAVFWIDTVMQGVLCMPSMSCVLIH